MPVHSPTTLHIDGMGSLHMYVSNLIQQACEGLMKCLLLFFQLYR